MTEQDQNEAIAKWMGWKNEGAWWESPEANGPPFPPDYVNDLNAMREAIDKIGDGQYEEFTVHLARAGVGNADRGYDMRPLYEATAAQRAEALLKTLSLWKEQVSKPCPKCGRPMAEETQFRGLWTCTGYSTVINERPLAFACDGFELSEIGAEAFVDYLMRSYARGDYPRITNRKEP